MGFTRRVFADVGGFDLDTFPEDLDFSIQAYLKGFELRPAPGATIHYRLRSDLKSIFRQSRSYSKTHVLTAKRYRAYGPVPRGLWAALLAECWNAGRWYLSWRFVRGAPQTAEAGRLYRKLGQVAGQFDGVVAHRGRPTLGLRPPDGRADDASERQIRPRRRA